MNGGAVPALLQIVFDNFFDEILRSVFLFVVHWARRILCRIRGARRPRARRIGRDGRFVKELEKKKLQDAPEPALFYTGEKYRPAERRFVTQCPIPN
jgi:hypothetical protein